MKEIGGYIELDIYRGEMIHSNGLKLNCAKNCFAFLMKIRDIKKIYIPYFLCDSIFETCGEMGVEIRYYHINEKFMPCENELGNKEDWVYIVNYYGLLPNSSIVKFKEKYNHIIVDNVQDYYRDPINGVDTFYSCRKFFGVPDGAILYTNAENAKNLLEVYPRDESYLRMKYLLGRFERSASEFYGEYVNNNKEIRKTTILQMSRLTQNLLHGLDYNYIKKSRTRNYSYLNTRLNTINKIKSNEIIAAFAYPLMVEDGKNLREFLIKNKIFVPQLWPNVLSLPEDTLEYQLSMNIIPIPCDQRYSCEEMEYICLLIERFYKK